MGAGRAAFRSGAWARGERRTRRPPTARLFPGRDFPSGWEAFPSTWEPSRPMLGTGGLTTVKPPYQAKCAPMYSPGHWLDTLSLVRTNHERPRLVWTGMVGRRQNQAPHAGVGGPFDACVASRPPAGAHPCLQVVLV